MNGPRPKAPGVRSGFDFTGLPLTQTARALSILATRLLERALEGHGEPDLASLQGLGANKVFVEKSGTPLTQLRSFSTMDRLVFLWRRTVRASRRLLKVTAPPLHRRLVGEAASVREGYRNIVRHAVAARITPRARRLLLEERLAARLSETWLMPAEMWALVAETAWAEPRFRMQSGKRIGDHLRDSAVFQLGEIPEPRFDNRTFWLLIVLTRTPKQSLKDRFSANRRRLIRDLKRLKKVAEASALDGEHWAGFWDQWLIARHLAIDPHAVFKCSRAVREAVIRLPYLPLAHLLYRLDEPTPLDIPQLAAPDRQIPVWAKWYEIPPDEPVTPLALTPGPFTRFSRKFTSYFKRFKRNKRLSMQDIQSVPEEADHVQS
ncbi:MAG: hypothetical protein QNK37_27920 [Acidobacteriota bacterium]|nr:hypothetical protein [Acidobacteriota bacterium]